jgi:hypothetical protein
MTKLNWQRPEKPRPAKAYKAEIPGTCPNCRRPIKVGQWCRYEQFSFDDGRRWVHKGCALS